MSEQRWAVLKDADRIGWIVVHPGDVFRTGDGIYDCWDAHSHHSTWEEAMQEADRMARTVTVTLPAYQNPTTINAEPASPVTIYKSGPLTQIEAGGVRFNLFRHELEPVALALLAHARGMPADRCA